MARITLGGPSHPISRRSGRFGRLLRATTRLDVVEAAGGFYDQKHPEAQDVLLLIEVSDSSLAFDQGTKLALYAQYGVAEYWVVDVAERRVFVHRQPTPSGSYLQKIEVRSPGTIVPIAFPDLEIAMSDVFG